MEFNESTRWWSESLGNANASGSQNDVHYAYFSDTRRLLIRQHDKTTMYDTGEHHITGVLQAVDMTQATFTSDKGKVDLSQLQRLQNHRIR